MEITIMLMASLALYSLSSSISFVFSGSLIDRRGYIQPDTPQPATPSNGIAAYGATQSQSDMVGATCSGDQSSLQGFSSASVSLTQ